MYSWILLLLLVIGGIGLRTWYVQYRRSERLRHAFLALEEKYEALTDQELGLRWTRYAEQTELEGRVRQLSHEIFPILKPQLDRLIYVAGQERQRTGLSGEELAYFPTTLEQLNLYLQSGKALTPDQQGELRETFREEMQTHLRQRLLYLEDNP